MDLFEARDRERRARDAPLAERMRPERLDEMVGLDKVLGPKSRLGRLLTGGRMPSLILWGPPGCGKTTLARLLAGRARAGFETLSAVSSGVKDLRAVVARARERSKLDGHATVLFIDEIHRYNKAQQDALLPHVEDGTLTLIGATTENPVFELNRPLLSRCRLITLDGLESGSIEDILRRALADSSRGLGDIAVTVSDDTLALISRLSAGDARSALNLLEASVLSAAGGSDEGEAGPTLEPEQVLELAQRPSAHYDKSGEEHYNALSALHKSLRGSDPDAALYWIAKMLEGGEDPRHIARRMIRFASEDVGLADPMAVTRAVSAWQAYEMLGRPEGELALAQCAVDLALAPRSQAMEDAWHAALADVRELGPRPVPLQLRNIKPGQSKAEQKATRYLSPHRYRHGVVPQSCKPEGLEDDSPRLPYVRLGDRGEEARLRDRQAVIARFLEQARREGYHQWKLD